MKKKNWNVQIVLPSEMREKLDGIVGQINEKDLSRDWSKSAYARFAVLYCANKGIVPQPEIG